MKFSGSKLFLYACLFSEMICLADSGDDLGQESLQNVESIDKSVEKTFAYGKFLDWLRTNWAETLKVAGPTLVIGLIAVGLHRHLIARKRKAPAQGTVHVNRRCILAAEILFRLPPDRVLRVGVPLYDGVLDSLRHLNELLQQELSQRGLRVDSSETQAQESLILGELVLQHQDQEVLVPLVTRLKTVLHQEPLTMDKEASDALQECLEWYRGCRELDFEVAKARLMLQSVHDLAPDGEAVQGKRKRDD